MIKMCSLLAVVIFIIGCSKVPDYADEKVLRDENGCAFVASKHIGDTMFLTFSKKDSQDSCQYTKYVGE